MGMVSELRAAIRGFAEKHQSGSGREELPPSYIKADPVRWRVTSYELLACDGETILGSIYVDGSQKPFAILFGPFERRTVVRDCLSEEIMRERLDVCPDGSLRSSFQSSTRNGQEDFMASNTLSDVWNTKNFTLDSIVPQEGPLNDQAAGILLKSVAELYIEKRQVQEQSRPRFQPAPNAVCRNP